LIAARGRKADDAHWMPEMITDDNGITHGFNESISTSDYREFVSMMLIPYRAQRARS
jgi:hypothetical protein